MQHCQINNTYQLIVQATLHTAAFPIGFIVREARQPAKGPATQAQRVDAVGHRLVALVLGDAVTDLARRSQRASVVAGYVVRSAADHQGPEGGVARDLQQ